MCKLNKAAAIACWKKEIEIYTLMVESLKKVLRISKKYDGKVLNCRFTKELEAKCPGVHFSLDLSVYEPCLQYSANYDMRRYEVVERGGRTTQYAQVCSYAVSLCKYEGRYSSVTLPYIDPDTRRLNYSAFVEVVNFVIADFQARIEKTEQGITQYDEVMAAAAKINEEIKRLKETYTFSGFGLERDRLEFYRLSY